MINAIFEGGSTSATSSAAYLHDYGQKLRIIGLDLPELVEAHFSLEESGRSILSMGMYANEEAIVPIPDTMLRERGSFFCYIFGRQTDSGRTMYKVKIPVLKRADLPMSTIEPGKGDMNYFETVLESVQESVGAVEAAKQEMLTGLAIGTVETLDAGEDATAEFVETDGGIRLNLGIPAGGAGEAESYRVTISGSEPGTAGTCDRTFAEITSAINAGKRVYAVFYYSDEEPCVMPLVLISAGQFVLFGGSYCYEDVSSEAYSIYAEYAYVGSDDAAYYLGQATTQLPTLSQYTDLEQRVTALEQALGT